MQRHIYSLFCAGVFIASSTGGFAQNVGVATPAPQAPFHVASSGQVNTPGGLVVLGDTTEGHLEMDFNLLQARYGANPLMLELQPQGGDFRVGSNLMHLNSMSGFLGVGTTSPDQKLEVEGSADQYVRIHTTSIGTSKAGLELLRSSEFNGTDWKIVNDGGTLRFRDGIDNFLTDGDLNMTMTSSGNLGLGIDPPESHLHVAGSTDQFVKIHRTTGGSGMAGLDLLRDVGSSGSDWRIVNDGGVLQFRDGIDNFSTEGDLNMVMTQVGNVGIGIEVPHSPLHINHDEFISETGDGFFQLGDPAGTHLRFDNNEILARSNDGPAILYLQFWSGDLSLCNDDAGMVGIGTSSPQAKVHITDGTELTLSGGGEVVLGSVTGANLGMDEDEIQARSNGGAAPLSIQALGGNLLLCGQDAARVGLGTTSPQAKLHITDGSDVSLAGGGQLVLGSITGANLAFDGNEILARDNGLEAPLFLQLSGGDVLMVPNETGQVGIGVTSMANMPSDDYLLAVDGKIISEEVRVELSGSWPDYVFEEDYSLIPLDQLEEKISTLGHLPGIPSASQVEAEGILLGDMQRVMMEKIEELTLYVIELKKEIETLKDNACQK